MPARLHFWRRVEGDVANEAFHPRPIARIRGRATEYHVCGNTVDAVSACLERGIWHWQYLGAGELDTIHGVVQYAGEKQRAAR
jgi:hypothetical protein